MFKLSIDTDNAAFDDAAPEEIARILRKLADKLETEHDAVETLRDSNGNRVGLAEFTRKRRSTKPAAALALFLLAGTAHAAEPCRVNVNTANVAQLSLLAQTGPSLAGRIAQARLAAPLTWESLDAVPGVGERWIEKNRPYVAFDGPTTCTEEVSSK